MSTIRELPSGRFNVQVRQKGQKPISRTFDDREAAQDWANRVEGKSTTSSQPKEAPPVVSLTLVDMGRRYCSTHLKDRPSRFPTQKLLESIARHLPEDVREITKYDINEYRLKRLETVSNVTCRNELELIHRLYRWAHRELLLDKATCPSPCEDVTFPSASKPRNRVIERDELECLLNAMHNPIMRTVVEVAYETAMRRGEILKLRPKDLHLDERILDVVDGKTGDRSVPLTTRAVELLREASRQCSRHDRIFDIEPHSVTTAFRRARRRAGLDDDVRFHQLRHSRITMVARKGFNQAQIMMVSGHRDVRSVQRYTHLNVSDVLEYLD